MLINLLPIACSRGWIRFSLQISLCFFCCLFVLFSLYILMVTPFLWPSVLLAIIAGRHACWHLVSMWFFLRAYSKHLRLYREHWILLLLYREHWMLYIWIVSRINIEVITCSSIIGPISVQIKQWLILKIIQRQCLRHVLR